MAKFTVRKGVDLSEHNPDFNFQKLVDDNFQFVLLRCGYGSDFPGQQDAKFLKFAEKADKLNIPYGVYHYAYATTVNGARAEAAHCMRLLKNLPHKPQYGVWYDVEDNSLLNDTSGLVEASVAFCDLLERAGYYVGIYAPLSFLQGGPLDSSTLDRFDKWVADWDDTCTYRKPYGIWQKTETGTVKGVKGFFDIDYAYKDYPALTSGEDDISQEEFEKMLSVYEEKRNKKPVSEWAVKSWLKAYSNQILDGTMPQAPVTREQVAAVLDRLDLL